MFDQMKKLMDLKKQADNLKRELEKVTIEYNEVRGFKIKLNGAQMFQSIEVEDSWLDPKQKSRFQVEIVRAVNMAIKKSQKEAAVQMQKIGGLNIPGLTS
ncbi:MAG: YbaB/EbfC family nucleoid-associated protein [Candidatus Omnitrophica bacterium]|nr:YbaB/EbfC family nucleoid-associated protein [Candidatus Omnitrophota bacterium]